MEAWYENLSHSFIFRFHMVLRGVTRWTLRNLLLFLYRWAHRGASGTR